MRRYDKNSVQFQKMRLLFSWNQLFIIQMEKQDSYWNFCVLALQRFEMQVLFLLIVAYVFYFIYCPDEPHKIQPKVVRTKTRPKQVNIARKKDQEQLKHEILESKVRESQIMERMSMSKSPEQLQKDKAFMLNLILDFQQKRQELAEKNKQFIKEMQKERKEAYKANLIRKKNQVIQNIKSKDQINLKKEGTIHPQEIKKSKQRTTLEHNIEEVEQMRNSLMQNENSEINLMSANELSSPISGMQFTFDKSILKEGIQLPFSGLNLQPKTDKIIEERTQKTIGSSSKFSQGGLPIGTPNLQPINPSVRSAQSTQSKGTPGLIQNDENLPHFGMKAPERAGEQTPVVNSVSTAGVLIAPAPQAVRNIASQQLLQRNMTSQQLLEKLMNFAESQTKTFDIQIKISNFGGARSNFGDLLIFAKNFIGSLQDRFNDGQATAFALKIYDLIVFKLIYSTNLRSGIENMPPKQRTSQSEKNSINSYILILNLYRIMGFEKIWLVVFGKTLKLLEFLFKRTVEIASHKDLQLFTNKYLKMEGSELAPKYLSRLDYLSYFLLGLMTFDPIEITRQLSKQEERYLSVFNEVKSLGKPWNYSIFWVFIDCFKKNKLMRYFQPAVYFNIMATIYPQVKRNKEDSTMKEFSHLYHYVLKECKSFFANCQNCRELENLEKEDFECPAYCFEGDTFKSILNVLKPRLIDRQNEIMNEDVNGYETHSNIFFYLLRGKGE